MPDKFTEELVELLRKYGLVMTTDVGEYIVIPVAPSDIETTSFEVDE